MDPKTANHFADIISLAEATFDTVKYTHDSTPERAILRLEAVFGTYRIYVTELFSDRIRKYRYYALKDSWVEIGFDNSPDPRAIRKKYGKIEPPHVGEYVPHKHMNNKTELEVTDEINFNDFVDWCTSHVAKYEKTD